MSLLQYPVYLYKLIPFSLTGNGSLGGLQLRIVVVDLKIDSLSLDKKVLFLDTAPCPLKLFTIIAFPVWTSSSVILDRVKENVS